jgi:hypothetical protein
MRRAMFCADRGPAVSNLSRFSGLPVQHVLTIIDDLPFESRELAYRPRRRVTCFSPWSALGLPHDAIREEMVKHLSSSARFFR